MFDGRNWVIFYNIPVKGSRRALQIIRHLSPLGSGMGLGFLRSCPWEEIITATDGVLVGVIILR